MQAFFDHPHDVSWVDLAYNTDPQRFIAPGFPMFRRPQTAL